MSQEIYDKILKIVEGKTSDNDRVIHELNTMKSAQVLENLHKQYKRINSGVAKPGNKNVLNSMVGYLIGLTTEPPSGDFVLPERLTYARVGFPDVDMDFDYERRDEVVQYISETYGSDRVGKIGVIQTLKSKNAVRRAIKVLDPDGSIVFDKQGKKIQDNHADITQLQNKVSDTLPDVMKKNDGNLVKNLSEAYKQYPDFQLYMDAYPEVFRIAQKMEGSVSAYSVHAGGLLLSPVPLCEIAPLHVTRDKSSAKDGEDKVVATQFPMKDVELLGLIKFDILGLSTKTAVTLAVKMIKENTGDEIDLGNLPLDDKDTLKLLSDGHIDGCFQLDSSWGMKQTLKEMGIDCFDDLVIAIAMFRPGPKDFIPELCRRKKNKSLIKHLHPIIKKYTERTYGIICFQESAMSIFVELAGLTATEGYEFIKGAAKKDPVLFNSMKERFIKGASKNTTPDIAQKVWDYFQPFSGYAFGKSHSASYAYESFKTAYLKTHYPSEFMAARMTVESQRRNFDDVERYENNCIKHLGIKILPIDLNRSKLSYTIVGNKEILRPMHVKGIGDKAAAEVVANQPYKGPDFLYSLAMKTGSSVNSKVIEALHEVGVFGSIKKEKALKDFEQIRKDKVAARGRPVGVVFE